MNKSWSFLVGVLTTILFSMCGLVFVPNWQFEELKPVVDQSGISHPTPPDHERGVRRGLHRPHRSTPARLRARSSFR